MKLLKVFNRINRRWVGDLLIVNRKFVFRNAVKDKKLGRGINKAVGEITRRKPRFVNAYQDGSKLIEAVKESELVAEGKNLFNLKRELNLRFPLLRFIETEEGKLNRNKLKEESREQVAALPFEKIEREKILKSLNKADLNDLILIKNDLETLERLIKLETKASPVRSPS